MIMSLKQREREFKPRIKLNHNINVVRLRFGSLVVFVCLFVLFCFASKWVEFYHHGLTKIMSPLFALISKPFLDSQSLLGTLIHVFNQFCFV